MKSTCFYILVSLTAVFAASVCAKRINQPIQYNHKKHVQELGMECTECHRYAKSMVRATIPNIEVCQDCHSEPMTESAEEQKLVKYIIDNEKIPWKKIYRVKPHVYFSHRRHTVLAELDCSVCHGDVSEMERPFTRQPVRVSMNNCMKCHENNNVDNDCTRCHR